MSTVSLVGLDKSAVFAALFNRAKAQGLGLLQYDPASMTAEQAQERFEEFGYFDYVDGRVMKVDLSGDELRTGGYNRDNGNDAAEGVIEHLHITGETSDGESLQTSVDNTKSAARLILGSTDDVSYSKEHGNVLEVHMGVSDIIDVLAPKIEDILEDK